MNQSVIEIVKKNGQGQFINLRKNVSQHIIINEGLCCYSDATTSQMI